jgi:WD40 repeat protein
MITILKTLRHAVPLAVALAFASTTFAQPLVIPLQGPVSALRGQHPLEDPKTGKAYTGDYIAQPGIVTVVLPSGKTYPCDVLGTQIGYDNGTIGDIRLTPKLPDKVKVAVLVQEVDRYLAGWKIAPTKELTDKLDPLRKAPPKDNVWINVKLPVENWCALTVDLNTEKDGTGTLKFDFCGSNEGKESDKVPGNGQLLPLGGAAMTFTPDSKTLIVANSKIVLINPATGKELHTLPGHDASIYSLVLDRTGKLLASGGEDKSVRVWDLTTHQSLQVIKGADAKDAITEAVGFTPDGKTLFTSGTLGLKAWDTTTWQLQRTLAYPEKFEINALQLTPDGKRLVLFRKWGAGPYAQIMDTTSGKILGQLDTDPKLPDSSANAPDGVALTADGKHLFTGSFMGGCVQLFDLTTGKQTGSRFVWSVHNLAASADGKRLALGGWHTSGPNWVSVYDGATLRPTHTFRPFSGVFRAVTISPDGRYVAASRNQDVGVFLWDLTRAPAK